MTRISAFLVTFNILFLYLLTNFAAANIFSDASPETFFKQCMRAYVFKNEKRITELVSENPELAKQFQALLLLTAKQNGENSKKMRVMAKWIGSFLSNRNIPDISQIYLLDQKGSDAYKEFKFQKAFELWEKALNLARQSNEKTIIGNLLMNTGLALQDMYQYNEALLRYEEALSVYQEIENKNKEIQILTNMGVVLRQVYQYEQSLKYYKNALTICREIEDRKGEGVQLTNMGNVFYNRAEYEKALSFYNRALLIDREIKNFEGESSDLINIGATYKELGQLQEALSYYKSSLEIKKDINDKRGEANNLHNICIIYRILERPQFAELYNNQALTIRKNINDRKGEIESLSSAGVAYRELNQYDKALSYYQQALRISEKIEDRKREGIARTNTGIVYNDLGQHKKAKQEFIASLNIFEDAPSPEATWKAQRGLAISEAKLNNVDKALVWYKKALDTIASIRVNITEKEFKTGYMQGKLYVYDEFIELLKSLHQKHPTKGYDKKSFEIFERKQGRIFLEEIGKSGARNFAGIPDAVLKNETELNNRLVKLRKDRGDEGAKPEKNRNMTRIRGMEQEMEDVIAEQQQLQEQIRSDCPDYYALRYPKPVSLKELQQTVLQSGEMMLIYGVMEKTACLWLVSRDHFSMHTIETNEKDLTEKVKAYRNLRIALSGRDLRGKVIHMEPRSEKETPDLYALLFPEPVQKTMAFAKTLYIIPAGPLYLLPFEALQDSKGRYLIENQVVAYLSSATLLKILRDARARRKESPDRPLLAFANPVYGESKTNNGTIRGMRSESYRAVMGGDFAELPETEYEARAIRDILEAPEKTKPLQLRGKASRSNVLKFNEDQLLDDYRYIVFACHGVLPGEINRIDQPALVLSDPDPQTKEQGFLTMADVFGLKLNADLVTLSACNTGRGKSQRGEGVMGLTRAFMYAGTPAISVTLWSVESQSAKELNVGFFRNLKTGKNRAEALREIKLAMLRGEFEERCKEPYFWAPVVVFGDGGVCCGHKD